MKINSKLRVIILLYIAFILRFLLLDKIPYRVDGDSSRFGLDGVKAWKEHWPLFSTGWYGHTNLYMYFVGFFINLTKNNLFGIRLQSALGGFLSIISTYFLAKKLFNKNVAFWSSFFLTFCPFHLVFSRVGTEVIWTIFFSSLSAYLFLEKSFKHYFASGFVLGLSQYVYPGARLLPISIASLSLLLLLHKKIKLKEFMLAGFLLLLGFTIVYGPMLLYYLNHPDTYMARINIVGIFQSGWLKRESQNKTLTTILLKQLYQTFLAFHKNVQHAPGWFYQIPYLEEPSIVLFTGGLLYGLYHIKQWQFQWMYIYLMLGIFLGGFLTINSPSPSRYVILFSVVAIFIGLGFTKFISLSKKIIKSKFLLKFVLGSFLAAISVFYLRSYYLHETEVAWRYDDNTQIASACGRFFSSLADQNFSIYFVGNQNMNYYAIPTLPFLSNKSGVDIMEGLDETYIQNIILKKIQKHTTSYFVILPSRTRDRSILEKYSAFPIQKIKNPLGKILIWIVKI